jgi:hypothetical protein
LKFSSARISDIALEVHELKFEAREFVARDMVRADLRDVVAIHRSCFPASVSLLSALNDVTIELYYQQYIEEVHSTACVLAMESTGTVVGYSVGTRRPGIRNRFAVAHPFVLATAIICAMFTSKAMWHGIVMRSNKNNFLDSGPFNNQLLSAGIPEPNGEEELWMGLAIHPSARGGGNAAALVNYYHTRVFETSDAVRVRGAILRENAASIALFHKLGWEMRDVTGNQANVWINRSSTSP